MTIKRIITGFLRENCYIISDKQKAIVIDPGADAKLILDACKDLDIVEVLVTHHHFDHIGALPEVLSKYNLNENSKSKYFNYEVINTPGHTGDSKSFYFKDYNVMFTGDFIFKGTIGRTDLPTGSIHDMKESLELISKYPKDTIIYPGHGNASTIGDEINRYKKAQ